MKFRGGAKFQSWQYADLEISPQKKKEKRIFFYQSSFKDLICKNKFTKIEGLVYIIELKGLSWINWQKLSIQCPWFAATIWQSSMSTFGANN